MDSEKYMLPYQRFDFEQALAPYETDKLRAAVMKLIPADSVLYHNHVKDGYLYGYPLMQYKSIRGREAILYLGEGVNYIGDLFRDLNRKVVLPSGDSVDFRIRRIAAKVYRLGLLAQPRYYRLKNWLPVQDDNYRRFRELSGEAEQEAFLRNILTGNILTFAKGVGWHVDGTLEIPDFHIKGRRWISYKDVKMLGFDLLFSVNAFLPPYIGLGKGAAKNYGVVTPTRPAQHAELKSLTKNEQTNNHKS